MGVERVRDVDVMPINPTENLPATFIESHSHILMNGHAMVEGQAVQLHRGSLRDGPPARGPAAGRAQQEARAAAAAAQAQSQESDMHTLSEVHTVNIPVTSRELALRFCFAAAAGIHRTVTVVQIKWNLTQTLCDSCRSSTCKEVP